MKNINFWKKLSNYSGIIFFIIAIGYLFIHEHITSIGIIAFILAAISLTTLLLGDFMQFFVEETTKPYQYWKRFTIIERLIYYFFLLNLVSFCIDKEVLEPIIPYEIRAYLFWLSLGLEGGFRFCHIEYNKAIRRFNNRSKIP